MMKTKKQADTSDIAAIAAVIVALCGIFLMLNAPADQARARAVAAPAPALRMSAQAPVVLASFTKTADLPVSRPALLPAAKSYQKELTCLTQAIYYEARSETYAGRLGVAEVVLNRVSDRRYPNSVCAVVFQGPQDVSKKGGCQFSFTCDGALATAPTGKAWNDAGRVAAQAMLGFGRDLTQDALNYHADYVVPKWASKMRRTVQIGRHIFYRFAG